MKIFDYLDNFALEALKINAELKQRERQDKIVDLANDYTVSIKNIELMVGQLWLETPLSFDDALQIVRSVLSGESHVVGLNVPEEVKQTIADRKKIFSG